MHTQQTTRAGDAGWSDSLDLQLKYDTVPAAIRPPLTGCDWSRKGKPPFETSSDMIAIGSLAPAFDGTAIIDGSAVAFSWRQLLQGRVLVLLFDSVDSGSNLLRELEAVPDATAEFARLEATVCVVCRDAMYELLTAGIPIPVIVDSDAEIANLYCMQQADGNPLWGHCIIDADGFVRRLVQCDVPVSSSLAELSRYVAAAGASDFMDMPC